MKSLPEGRRPGSCSSHRPPDLPWLPNAVNVESVLRACQRTPAFGTGPRFFSILFACPSLPLRLLAWYGYKLAKHWRRIAHVGLGHAADFKGSMRGMSYNLICAWPNEQHSWQGTHGAVNQKQGKRAAPQSNTLGTKTKAGRVAKCQKCQLKEVWTGLLGGSGLEFLQGQVAGSFSGTVTFCKRSIMRLFNLQRVFCRVFLLRRFFIEKSAHEDIALQIAQTSGT